MIEISRLSNEISNLSKKILDLNSIIIQLNETIIALKKDNIDYQNNIKKLSLDNSNLVNQIKNSAESNKNNYIKSLDNEKDEMLISLMKRLELKDNQINKLDTQINKLKEALPFELKNGEKLLPVIFVTDDQKVHYSLICKDNEKFNNVENRLYEVYPQYEEEENYFTVNGRKIIKSKTLKDNKIKYSDIIVMIPVKN